MKALMLCGHGSRDEAAVREFAVLAERLRDRLPDWAVEYGYLEFAQPVIRNGLDKLREKGARDILALPGMLFAAGHAKNDIPSVLNTYAAQNGVSIRYGRELGVDLKMIRAAGERIRECLRTAGWRDGEPLHDSLLVVVGRGSSDPDANSNVAKVTRMLWEGLGFAWAETVYSGVTFPLVKPGLEHVARLGYKRVVVFPYFLFTGILVRRVYEHTDRVAAEHPDITFLKAGYLNDHPLVIDTFAERLEEILAGANVMNCQMCKYREQVLGFEAEVGLPQESHHHHVEGIGTGEAHHHHHSDDGHTHHHHHHDDDHDHHHHDHGEGHDHDHHHDHGHDHHHHPYPHADHPLGPRSLTKR
ncbi:sirohydrochlorin chelatase [Consotaella salsifontis]|uniref:Sirohydrochlorin cobaltochelatase n=1 Tax=Consotaella salsifontis TaxID=1365950 RepID=A0A1T4SJ39_9HYPH|nr:sirohydrochlorin chelatase [Consotaella salsifontis]SKA28196.1 sirohydrochlorin cobaltochelatase [Consotaella salsifontis]